MAALLDDAAVIDDEDDVGADDGREAVGDRQDGAALGQAFQGLLDGALGLGVHARGRFVEDEDGRVLEQGAGDGDALLLAAGEAVAALADDGVVTPGQVDYEVVDVRGLGGLLNLLVAGVGAGVTQVLADRGVKEERLLVDHRYRFAERRQA